MKNIFKLMGLALMASTLMVACGSDEKEDTPTVAEGINVNFDGTTWTAGVNDCALYAAYGALQICGEKTAENYPMFDEVIYTTEVGTTTEQAGANGQFQDATHRYVEYYESGALTDGTYNYGDWWALNATTNIKNIDLTALTLTAEMNGTMFSAREAFVGDNATGLAGASQAPYTVTAGNISLTSAK